MSDDNKSLRVFSSMIPESTCKRGCNKGYVIDEHGEPIIKNNESVRCQCYYEGRYLDSNIGKSYWNLTLENFEGHPDDLNSLKYYISKASKMYENGKGLYIHGGNGVGKTTLAILFLKHIIHNSKCSALFAPFADLVILNSRIIGGFHDKDADKSISYIKNVDFLVLDDIGKEFDNGKDYTRATLNSILRYRDLWNKPTIYTANSPLDVLREHYGDSNYSIMLGRSMVITSKYQNDHRKEKKMEGM